MQLLNDPLIPNNFLHFIVSMNDLLFLFFFKNLLLLCQRLGSCLSHSYLMVFTLSLEEINQIVLLHLREEDGVASCTLELSN
jgi:hypothetical protein